MGSPQWRGGGLSDTQPHLQVPLVGARRKVSPPPRFDPSMSCRHWFQASLSPCSLMGKAHLSGARWLTSDGERGGRSKRQTTGPVSPSLAPYPTPIWSVLPSCRAYAGLGFTDLLGDRFESREKEKQKERQRHTKTEKETETRWRQREIRRGETQTNRDSDRRTEKERDTETQRDRESGERRQRDKQKERSWKRKQVEEWEVRETGGPTASADLLWPRVPIRSGGASRLPSGSCTPLPVVLSGEPFPQ